MDSMNDSKAKSPLQRQPIHTISVGGNIDKKNAGREAKSGSGVLEKEFGGALGALVLILALPAALLVLNLKIVEGHPSLFQLPEIPNLRNLLSEEAWLLAAGWFIGHMIFSVLPIGRLVKGRPLVNGKALDYRCNGFGALVVCIAGLLLMHKLGVPVAKFVEEKWLELATVSMLISAGLSVFVYLKSFEAPPSELSLHGSTGNIVYDFFMGRELNPRLGPLDLKFACELRPGLIGWVMLDLALMISDYDRHGSINWTLAFLVAVQTAYVADALWFEPSILSTMDIVEEGFGYMLAFGDLAWVPFTYTLQARYIATHPRVQLSYVSIVAVFLLSGIGSFIFRASNLQKDRFRNDPKHVAVRELPSIPTGVKGRRLLCGGWWGWLRHPNYLGDILMAWSWCLTCGFGSVLPYFYGFYLTALLISREIRDEKMNLRKYGSAWTEYCRRVPFRIFPGIW